MPDCTLTPNDPICLAYAGQPSNADRWRAALQRTGGVFVPMTPIPTAPSIPQVPPGPLDQSPIDPGKIVTTTAGVTTFWSAIPTPVKLIGAGVIAFLGYRALTKKPK